MIKFILYFIFFIILIQSILYYINVDLFDLYDNNIKYEIRKVIDDDITELKNSINQLKKMNEIIYNGEGDRTEIQIS